MSEPSFDQAQAQAAAQAQQEAYGRVMTYGTVWLNSSFVAQDVRGRVFKRVPFLQSVRLGKVEAIWIMLSLLVLAPSLYGVTSFLSAIPGLGVLVAPWTGAVVGVALCWPIGRRIARISPYRRHSGEGLTEFLYVQSNKRHTLIGRLFGRSVAVTKCETYVTGKREVVDCIEWIGTARAKYMPDWDPDNPVEFMDIHIPPRHIMINWVDQRRARRRLAGAKRG